MPRYSPNSQRSVTSGVVIFLLAIVLVAILLVYEALRERPFIRNTPAEDWVEQSSKKSALRWLSKKFPAEPDTSRLSALPLSEWHEVYPEIELISPELTNAPSTDGMLICREHGFTLWRAGKNWLVSDVFHKKDQPSEGLRTGMIVNKINGKEIENLDTQELNQILRDANHKSLQVHVVDLMKGTETSLTLEANSAIGTPVQSKSIMRQLSSNIYYVRPDYWGPKTYYNIMTGLESLNFIQNQTNHLILDLRGVEGDDVAEAAKLLSQWTSNKGELLFSLRGPRFKQIDFKSTGKTFSEWRQIVILADEYSGLASALLAAASVSITHRRVILNGTLSEKWFKETLKLPNGLALRIPVAEVILPDGKRPHEIKPEATIEHPSQEVIPDSASSHATRSDQQDSLARITAFNYFVNWSGQLASGKEVLTKEANLVQLTLRENLVEASPKLAEPGKEAILMTLTDKAYYYFLGMLAGSPLSQSLLPLYDHQITEALKEIKKTELLK